MPRRTPKRRKLWLNIKVRSRDRKNPIQMSPAQIRDVLIDSIRRGDYQYPSNWYVQIEWRNREFDDMKIGEFSAEMNQSRLASLGWDTAVINYLRGKS